MSRIAIIGSGIAGLTCAHVLGPHHELTLFEASGSLGGHSNTVTVTEPRAGSGTSGLGVDTGFIVHNDRNYPNLVKLFAELGVATQKSEMSFSVWDRGSNFCYRATNLNTFLASRRNVVRRDLWTMLVDIRRFFRAAREFLDNPDPDLTIGEFVSENSYSTAFVELYLIPMGASVWSADPSSFTDFPAVSLLRFFDNHGLLSVRDRPQWRTVVGGSRRYVDAIAERFAGEIRLATPVVNVLRHDDGVVVEGPAGSDVFDRVILACHSDQALGLLADPTVAEKEILGAIGYQPNKATLHTDVSLLPARRRAWAAWNYRRESEGMSRAVLTYDLTTLQRLPGSRRFLVSLNCDDHIDEREVIARFDYAHPVFDQAAIHAQQRFEEIDGFDRTHYCGAYWGYGFHEDGVTSALRVCERIGVSW